MTTYLKKMKMAAALLAGALACAAVQAGEIIFYEDSGFNGRYVSLRDAAPDFNNIGFNDLASSIVVRSGRWEVCTDADFRGRCMIVERGEYPSLDGNFNDRISSAREIRGGVVSGAYGGSIELFGQPGFRGRSIQLEHDMARLDNRDFNDRAASAVVRDGTWVLCTDADYRGTCRTYGPGRYADLGDDMNRSISSARIARGRNEGAPPIAGGGTASLGVANSLPQVTLYDGDDLRGRSMAVSGTVADLGAAGFNDAAASMVVQNGYWEFCSDAHFRGQCRVFGPGQYRRLEPALYRSISSVRAATRETGGGRAAGGRGEVELFTAPDFGGGRMSVRTDLENLDRDGFNDRTASLIVHAGQWEICTDAHFSGRCSVFGPGRYPNLGGMTNHISSLRRVD